MVAQHTQIIVLPLVGLVILHTKTNTTIHSNTTHPTIMTVVQRTQTTASQLVGLVVKNIFFK
jgi:hypothetical protein